MHDLTPEEQEILMKDKPHNCVSRLVCLLTGKGIITRDEAVDICYHIPETEKHMPKGLKYLEHKGMEVPSGAMPIEDANYEPPETDPTLVGPGIGFGD